MKLIGIDLDGTLLNSKQKISERNVEVLKEISSSSLPFICSGREVADIKQILKESDLSLLAVGSNGAVGHDEHEQLFEFSFNQSSVEAVNTVVADFPTKIFTNAGSYESLDYIKELKNIFDAVGNEYDRRHLDYELAYASSVHSTPYRHIGELVGSEQLKVYKFFVFIPNKQIKQDVQKQLAGLNGVSVTESSDVNLEIVPDTVSKGFVYGHLEKIYQLSQTTRFAIGDSLNDLSLFEHADISFAMANGHPKIKDIATHVIPSNDEDGVSDALRMIAGM
ncbi:HAD family hydrolase [Vagococcus acidifermentans]|uniref:Haloacid dehalogenase n=1 Tax=Vagococcus acidifermentans TaxID=564710 RepID=A0A430AY04_9ENTE|nr:HAD family hydrolase [Vagococcus acidifermentans]RSU12943.1 haloacid dehalogenase [Vagococcus acidifermentans]